MEISNYEGAAATSWKGRNGKVTRTLMFASVTAACGGFLFGYDLGISGGVTSMDDFLLTFYKGVYRKKQDAATDNYCKFDSQLLELFTSSLYIADFITTLFFASRITRSKGRRFSILIGSVAFLLGSVMQTAAVHIAMLILGRVILGIGLGFTTQAVPLYLSEMATPNLRGRVATMFPIAIALGGTIAFLVNYGTGYITPWGWRLSLGLAFLPALFITIGCVLLHDSPTSLIERGFLDEGLSVLRVLRGTRDVEEEFNDIIKATQESKAIQKPWTTILQRRYRPELVMAIFIPFFQQVTGSNMVTFYAPVLFQTLGFGSNASLYSAVILGVLATSSNIVAAFSFDKYGRRKLFIYGGLMMFIFLVLTGSLLQWKLGPHNTLSTNYGIIGIILICLFVMSFSLSWGPLGWMVSSEIFPLEIRSVGQSINLTVIMIFTSLSTQFVLTMLCHLKAAIFFFFAFWVFIMTLFIYFLFPETKNVPLEKIETLWAQHPFWRSCYS